MSRLDSFIRRVTAQRDCLDHVAVLLDGMDGPVLELGLGNGRTFDHLRERLPGRRIVAFDRKLAAHRNSTPPPDDLVLGEIAETAAAFAGVGAALVHADIGTGYEDKDAATLSWLPGLVARLPPRVTFNRRSSSNCTKFSVALASSAIWPYGRSPPTRKRPIRPCRCRMPFRCCISGW